MGGVESFMRSVQHRADAMRDTVALWALGIGRAQRYYCVVCESTCHFIPQRGRFPRSAARCSRCQSAERHRFARLILEHRVGPEALAEMTVLHCAPEGALAAWVRQVSASYVTADIQPGYDFQVDLTQAPFPSQSFDLVIAIHVLEHIRDDSAAMAEIARILRPGGVALVAVPIVTEMTVEYSAANSGEYGHWRAPGPDYYPRWSHLFGAVDVVTSEEFGAQHRLSIIEDRTIFPNGHAPERPPQGGLEHRDAMALFRV